MRLLASNKIAIGVGLNEMVMKAENPEVPYGPEEVAESSIAAARQGASIIHYHSRYDDGSQALDDDERDADIYRRGAELTAKGSDVIMWGTGFPRGKHDVTRPEDKPHLKHLSEKPPAGSRLEVLALDCWRLGSAGWDAVAKRLRPLLSENSDTRPDFDGEYEPAPILTDFVRRGVTPFFCMYSLRDVNFTAALARDGFVPQPVIAQIQFWGDRMTGPPPTIESLDAFINAWPDDVDAELWLPVALMPDLATHDRLLAAAMVRGINIRVGIGDNPLLFRSETNAEIVMRAADLAVRLGFEPATPTELRARLNLPNPTARLQSGEQTHG